MLRILVTLMMSSLVVYVPGCNGNRGVKLDPVILTQDNLRNLDPIILTQDDLPIMQVTSIHPISGTPGLSVIAGFRQWWSGDLNVKYWLFDAASTAKQAAETGAHHISAAPMNWQPERNPEDIIGNATWRHIHWEHNEWEYRSTHIVFVKNNVLVNIMAGKPSIMTDEISANQLQLVRDVARKIEAKIEAVLNKKGYPIPSRFELKASGFYQNP